VQGACVTPPRSRSGYSSFLLGGRRVEGGEEFAVGTITLGTGHADLRLGADATKRHYEDTGMGVVDVVMGEDRWGPWFSGAVRRGVTEPQVEELRAAKISGDWRAGPTGSLDLVGLLAVNVPGFPVPRPRARLVAGAALVADGELVLEYDGRAALVAAHICPRSETVRRALVAGLAAYDESLQASEARHRELAGSAEFDALLVRAKMPDLLARARG
jgi:hypothetical protein